MIDPNPNTTIKGLTREIALTALGDLIAVTNHLAEESMVFLNNHRYFWSTAAKILLGFDVRKNLLAIRSLARDDLDDQVFIIYRVIFEHVVSLEYISKSTIRGKRKLSPTQKAFLFISFPVYERGQIDKAFQVSRDFKLIARRRRKLVNDDRYWHGSNLKAICRELDSVRKDGKSPNVNSYEELYGNLSFISHPNSKENIHYTEDPITRRFNLRPYFHFDGNIFFSNLWASKAIRRWAVAVKSEQVRRIDSLDKSWVAIIRGMAPPTYNTPHHDAPLSKMGY